MEHIALYRQFRPMTFDEIVEQNGPVSSLRHAAVTHKIGHAYLFSGQRGTGKTSIAKVFSRAINCINPINGNPCNKCEICSGILNNSLMDVIEIDAASNNSVDNIRRICEEVNFAPSKASYKVYIIDEVHMLSTGAFNALLKTLEEPPKHVVFILATTEPHRIPATIHSRCQRYNFKRISNESIERRLRYICDKESIKATDDALSLIASLSDGAMRDAISLLDQVGSFASDKTVGRDDILQITGTVDDAFLGKVAKALIGGDYETIITSCDELANSGRDIIHFAVDLAQYFRDLLVVRMMPNPLTLVKVQTQTLKTMYEICENVAAETLVAFISKLSSMISDLRWSPSVRTSFEITLIQLCGRKVKVDPVPLVIPDFVKKQELLAKSYNENMIPNSPVKEEKDNPPTESVETVAEDMLPPPPIDIDETDILPSPTVEPSNVPDPENIVPISGTSSDANEEDEAPLQNQIDLFTLPIITYSPEDESDNTSESVSMTESTSSEKTDSSANIEDSPLLGIVNSSFLDDIPSVKEPKSSRYHPPTSLAAVMRTEDEIIINKVPVHSADNEQPSASRADIDAIWESIYSATKDLDIIFYSRLQDTELRILGTKAYIVFDNSYTTSALKELTKDELYTRIRDDIKAVLNDIEHVYVATENQYQNELRNGMAVKSDSDNTEQSNLDSMLNKAQQLGIDIHFGDD